MEQVRLKDRLRNKKGKLTENDNKVRTGTLELLILQTHVGDDYKIYCSNLFIRYVHNLKCVLISYPHIPSFSSTCLTIVYLTTLHPGGDREVR